MPEHGPTLAYRCLSLVLLPVMLLHAIMRSFKDGGSRYFRQRCAIRQSVSSAEKPRRWIHAASVGEVLTAMPLIKELQLRTDNAPLLVTTTTPTGAQVLLDEQLQGVEHRYLPMDTRGACKRFISQYTFASLWIVETEIWPWLLASCYRQRIPVTIISARLSPRTTDRSSGFVGGFLRSALQGVRILARSEADAQRYINLGSAPEKTQTVGNLKEARAADYTQNERLIKHDYVVAASTHEDEEWQLARCWQNIQTDALLVIAPRHPERGQAIQKQLQAIGIDCALRSANEPIQADQRVYIADTVGELMQWYAHAEAAFVGGSLIERGGQNMLEPALFSCPTVVGRHTGNFEQIMDNLHRNTAISVANDATEVVQFLIRASRGDTDLKAMAVRARQVAIENSTVLSRYAELLFP